MARRIASRALSRFTGGVDAGPAAFAAACAELPRSTHAAGSASSTIAAMLWMANAQPATAVMPWAIGTKMNWPNEPPALTMPLAMPRFSGGARRAVAESSTDGPAKPAPPAARTPMATIRPKVVVISGTSAVPRQTRSRPKRRTRPAP